MNKQTRINRLTPVSVSVSVSENGYYWEKVRFSDQAVEWLEVNFDEWVESIHEDHPEWTWEQTQKYAEEQLAQLELRAWSEALVEVNAPVSLNEKLLRSLNRTRQGLPAKDETGYRKYNPMEEQPTLYLDFSRLDPTKDSIQAFASKWGKLGLNSVVRRLNQKGSLIADRGETIDEWTVEIFAMRDTVELLGWLHFAERNVSWAMKRLAERFAWRDGKLYHCREGHEIDETSFLPAYVKEGNSVLAGWWYVQRQINERLKLREATGTRAIYHQDTGAFTLSITSSTLRGALWLQCINALSEGKRLRPCANCGRHFEVHPGQRRADAMYCGRACRHQVYYFAKGKAKRQQKKRPPPE